MKKIKIKGSLVPLSLGVLKCLTFLFVAFPLIPFYLGWVKVQFAFPLLILLLVGGFYYIKNIDFTETIYIKANALVGIISIVTIWVSFSGSGGMGYQFHDLTKINTISKELTNNEWPIKYNVENQDLYLAHYLGYFLISPSVLGFLGYKYVQLGVFLVTYFGMLLGVFWVLLAAKSFKIKSAIVFILFGGLALFSFILKYRADFISEIIDRFDKHLYVFWMNSWEVIPINYMSVTDMFYWAPQHYIAALLGIGVLLHDAVALKSLKYTPFFLSLLVFWSPLVLVGIFFYLFYFLVKFRFANVFNWLNLGIATVLFLVNSSFVLSIESKELIKGFILVDPKIVNQPYLNQIGAYGYFLLTEVIIWALAIWFNLKSKFDKDQKSLFFFTLVLLILIPLYRFGLWNDWVGRVSVAPLTVFAIFLIRALSEKFSRRQLVLWVLLVIGSLSFLIDFGGSLKYSGFRPKFNPPLENQVVTLPEWCVGYPLEQFVAKKETFFFKYLAKEID